MTAKTAPKLSEAAQAVADQLAPGVVIQFPGHAAVTVKELKGRSVWFTNGTYEHLRSLADYQVR